MNDYEIPNLPFLYSDIVKQAEQLRIENAALLARADAAEAEVARLRQMVNESIRAAAEFAEGVTKRSDGPDAA